MDLTHFCIHKGVSWAEMVLIIKRKMTSDLSPFPEINICSPCPVSLFSTGTVQAGHSTIG